MANKYTTYQHPFSGTLVVVDAKTGERVGSFHSALSHDRKHVSDLAFKAACEWEELYNENANYKATAYANERRLVYLDIALDMED
jgi:hypothetical protein